MAAPLISILTATYNRADLLPRAWESLKRQDFADFEWIVIDDGSTDDTRSVVEGFRDPRIRYLHQPNGGVNSARNLGETALRSDLATFLDSDDELLGTDSLSFIVREMSGAPQDVGYAEFPSVDGQGRAVFHRMELDRVILDYPDSVCRKHYSGEFFPVYRREALKTCPWPPYNGYEVIKQWRIAKRYRALVVNRPVRIYHVGRTDQLTGIRSLLSKADSFIEAVGVLQEEHGETWKKCCPGRLGRSLFYKAFYAAVAGRTGLAWAAFFASLRWLRGKRLLLVPALAALLLLPTSLRRPLLLLRARLRGKPA